MSNNLLTLLQQEQIKRLTENKVIPDFRAGDTVSVKIEFTDGVTTRFQNYEGLVIAKRNKGICSSFTVRRVVGKSATERTFPIFAPTINSITVIKYGKARRAKLYYLQDKYGKSARIKEDLNRKAANKVVKTINAPTA